MSDFDVLASPLRVGGVDAVPAPLLIEAGAGSGKTWTLVHLAVRLMVEDQVEPDQVLLVTFTRDAARELRGRVRAHLDVVIAFLSGAATPDADAEWRVAWSRRLADPAARESDLRRARLCRSTLDGLHARTIHSFAAVNAARPAGGLGDDGRLRRQALAETRARWALRRSDELALLERHGDPSTLDAVAWALYEAGVRTRDGAVAVDILPGADEPADDEATRAAHVQRELALDVVHRFCALLAQERRTSYADLVVGLADRLGAPDAAAFVAELRATFAVVMIDEFQDTDPLQWMIFRDVFLGAPGCRLVVVGDPKQAIYRFRSATVETLLEVREDCRARGVPVATLRDNYRSTPQLVSAVNELFAGADFHYALERPSAEPVIAYQVARSRVRDDAPGAAPLELRVAPYRREADPTLGEVAAYVELNHARGVAYREIAILASTNEECRRVHRFLARRRIPSTTSSDVSIFDCAAARQLRHLLAALEAPEDAALTEALRATWFAGPGAEDPTNHAVGRLVTRLSGSFSSLGVSALTRFLRSAHVQTAVAAQRDGERHLTDLAHLSELVTSECHGVTLPALVLAWLDSAVASLNADEDTATRRLETESDAVRVLTVHKAKGLEFDVVLLPYPVRGYREVAARGRSALRRWVSAGRTVVDAGSGLAWGSPRDALERDRRTEAADAAEQRRLLYVALTRARRRTVAWMRLRNATPFEGEFARLVLDREVTGEGTSAVRNRTLGEVRALFVGGTWSAKDDPAFREAKRDPLAVARRHFAASSTLAVNAVGAPIPDAPQPAPDAAPTSADVLVTPTAPALAFQRRRWSYSEVARDIAAGESDALEDLDEVGGVDEARPSLDDRVLAAASVRPDVAGVFGPLAGTRLGLVVHRVLERHVGSGEGLGALLDDALSENGVGPDEVAGARDVVLASLARVVARPLTCLGGRALDALSRADVATEMRFLLALGERASRERLRAAVDAVLEGDRSGPDGRGLFAGYFGAASIFEQRLSEGYLVGSLDLTVRDARGGYRVMDYKTDQLAGERRPYAPERLAEHMAAHHYPLQALFYSVALHRFLRSRLVGYDPQRHLAGVDYFFVRVVGDATSTGDDGVLTWPITPGAVVAASDALGSP